MSNNQKNYTFKIELAKIHKTERVIRLSLKK